MHNSDYVRRAAACLLSALLLAGCGGGDDAESESPEATVAPTDGNHRARALAISVQQAALAKWTAPIGLSIVPAAGTVLANGKVLFWAADNPNGFGGPGNTWSTLFDPATNTSVEYNVTETGHDMFCPATTRLPDGKLLVVGGYDAGVTSLYDPATNAWSKSAPLNIARAYNAGTLLADGSVMTLGGSWAGNTQGGKNAEIYTPGGSWRVLSGVPADPYLLDGVYRGWQSDAHMALFPTANGKVLMAGPAVDMAWIDTRGNGSSMPAGRRGDDTPSLAGPMVMYEAGKILKVGGAVWNNDVPASANAYLIDTTSGAADVRKLSPMAYPRIYANSVVLPNGQVLVVGGQTYAQEFSDSNAVLAPELFDPQTQTFTLLPPMKVARNYHGVALLLPDARVVVAGGGLCGCVADHPDLEIMSPPYLFNADGSAATRPVITGVPATLKYGSSVAVTTSSPVTAFSMVRLGAGTHTVNNDQRRISLGFTAGSNNRYRVSIPTNPGLLLPGQWMLFAMNAQGTPSVAKIVTVDATGAPVLQNPGDVDIVLGQPMTPLQPTATTPSGRLGFGASGLPAGLRIDVGTGAISGTPSAAGSFVSTVFVDNGNQTVSTDVTITVSTVGSGTGLAAQYFANPNLSGLPAVQRTEAPNFNWGAGAPAPGLPVDNVSVRWSGWIEATGSGATGLRTISDDAVRVWVNNQLVIDKWASRGASTNTVTGMVVGGQRYPITIEYLEASGNAAMQLQWQLPGAVGFVPVPAQRLYSSGPPSTTNIALGQAASQSSLGSGGGVASRAVDGNVSGVAAAGSLAQTAGTAAYDWWQVDLGRLSDIDLVQLWNRTDCCSELLGNFIVFVSATDMTGRTLEQLRADPAVINRQVGPTSALPNIGVPLNALGRYVRVQLLGTGVLALAEVQVFGGPVVYRTPTLNPIGDQQGLTGGAVSLAAKATDPDGNSLTYSASGLPAGLRIDPVTGVISGAPTTPGNSTVTVSVANAGNQSASTRFAWTVLGMVPEVTSLPAPLASSGATVTYSPVLGAGVAAQYSWNFGDGTGDTAFSGSAGVSHRFTAPGAYTVTLTIRTSDGRYATERVVQGVSSTDPKTIARASSDLLLEPRGSSPARLWVVNGDNDSVSVFDTGNNARIAEVPVGSAPRSLALLPDGRIWVVNKQAASISIVSPSTLSVVQTLALPRGSQPFGIVAGAAAGSSAFVALEATGQLLKLDGATGAVQQSLAVGDNPRHLALTAAGEQLLVSRYLTRPLPGEGTASVRTTDAGTGARLGGEVVVVNTATLTAARTVVLAHSDRVDGENQGRGIPNYLGAPAIAPDGRSAWVPSKQDNVLRGKLRDNKDLDFQSTVRAISSRIELASGTEDAPGRIDHDNASVASAALHHPSGVYLFVALETSREVAVVDSVGKRELFRFDVGLAPQGLALSPDGMRLYASNALARSVSAIDLQPLLNFGQIGAAPTATLSTLATADKLSPTVLRGKQLFYDAADSRLARDSYMSCASCHNDGGHDGRTWDMTGHGEGLRNTVSLRGRAGLAHGFAHWSANFDEVQDFEAQIRRLAGGSGLMLPEVFNAGTRSQPLGDPKAGRSADLDALAAYVSSLGTFAPSPWRPSETTLTAAAQAGKTVFVNNYCASCHGGTGFTSSANGGQAMNIGTLKPSSGTRSGAALPGIDIPTLRDVWATAPYLHDGSAPTLAAAVQAHNTTAIPNPIPPTDLANLAEYLRQIGSDEGTAQAPSPPPPPASNTPTACAPEGGVCTIPAGSTATVMFGANGAYFSRPGLTGSIGCNATSFGGDPIAGVAKGCSYTVTSSTATPPPPPPPPPPPSGPTQCAVEGGVCTIPAGSSATVRYGANGSFVARAGVTGSINCNNATFGSDPIPNVAKSCTYEVTGSSNPPPSPAFTPCAAEGGTCALPAGSTATVRYGAEGSYFTRQGVTGSIACTNASFGGDPVFNVAKTCGYTVTSTAPPASPTACASEGGTCTVPAGSTATVSYGANGSYYTRQGVTGSIACTNAAFGGDPIFNVAKTCSYQVTTSQPATAVACANEGGTCTVPAGRVATVTYGADGVYFSRQGVTGAIACTNVTFGGDPAFGVAKACAYQITGST